MLIYHYGRPLNTFGVRQIAAIGAGLKLASWCGDVVCVCVPARPPQAGLNEALSVVGKCLAVPL